MPSAKMQKLASGLSSGVACGAESPPSSSRGGGVIRGLLQSIRAGLSTESLSPRSSRTGLIVDAPVTPRGNQSQQILASNPDSAHAGLDDSDADEDLCTRAFSSGPKGRATFPAITRGLLLSESGRTGLPLEVPPASSRIFSGRRSATPARSAISARPSFESMRSEASAAFNVPSGSRGLSSGPTPVLRAADAIIAVLPPPQLPTAPWSGSAATYATDAVRQPPQAPVGPASGAARNAVASPSAPAPAGPETCPEAPSPPDAAAAAASGLEEQPPVRQGSDVRSVQPSSQRRLLKAPVATPDAAQGAPPTSELEQRPESDRIDGSSNGGADSDGDNGAEAGGGADAAGVGEAAAAAATPGSAVALSPFHSSAVQLQDAAQRQVRSASSSALSAMAVSQAVHRLQMRQQQEKAAARFSRSSAHMLGVTGNNNGGGGLHHQYTSQSHHGQHQHYHREIAAMAPTHRVLSVASDNSTSSAAAAVGGGGEQGEFVPGDDAAAAAAAGAPAWQVGSGMSGGGPLQSPLQPSPAQQSPSRRLGLPMAQSRSAASNFMFQHALYDGHRLALSAGACGSGGGPSVGRTEKGADLDELLGDVPDMSLGRVVPASASDWGGRSSASYTEGHVSAAERLQAMVSSAASVGGDDAASYLQQLLVPDMPSTASADMQYSATITRVPSVVALAYGSSGGPCTVGGGGLWGLLHCSSSSPMGFSGYGEPFLPSSPAATGGGAHARHPSAQGQPLYGEHLSGASIAGPSSGAGSRPGSLILNSQTAPPLFGGNQLYSSTGYGGPAGSATSGSGTFALEATSVCPHASKSAEQLVKELLELHSISSATVACPTAAVPVPVPAQQQHRGGSRRASTGTVFGATFAAASGSEGTGGGGEASQQQLQQREELVAALWRLLRAKDSAAVTYLLAVDPAAKPHRLIAPVLKEMRSWVYVNMW